MVQREAVRVIIDAHMLGSGETGNETYVANLLPNLAESSDDRYAVAVTTDTRLPADLKIAGIQVLPLRPPGDLARLLFSLPALCRRWHADVLHVPYVGPLVLPCRLVVSLHDVSFKRYPKFFSPRDRILFATLLPLTLRRASAVITLSEHARQEVLGHYPYLDGRVHVIYLAPAAEFRPIDEAKLLSTVRTRYGIKGEFILAVGNLQPRKNLLRLVHAFSSIRRKTELVQLVIVGKAQWQASQLFAEVKRLELEQDVIFTGYAPTEDLVQLYNGARVFVYPSIYEGFGLPVLEAMACGTPVVASNASSMPEVAADAALLVDPFDEQDIAQAIHHVMTNEDLARSLAEKGTKQAKRFSWRKTALETAALYRNVAGQQHTQE